MDQITKQPVEITQELIALYTTRKEVYDKLSTIKIDKKLSEKIPGIISQSDLSLKELNWIHYSTSRLNTPKKRNYYIQEAISLGDPAEKKAN